MSGVVSFCTAAGSWALLPCQAPERNCDFVCDCTDCSDEQNCGTFQNVGSIKGSHCWKQTIHRCQHPVFLNPYISLIVSFFHTSIPRLQWKRVCVRLWGRGNVWMDWPVLQSSIQLGETSERRQWAVLWLYNWHSYRYSPLLLLLCPRITAFIFFDILKTMMSPNWTKLDWAYLLLIN